MLISTSCSMFYEATKIAIEKSILGWISILVLIVWVAGLEYLHKKFKLNDIVMLLGSAAISLIGLLFL
jgi:hypothetical protein